MTRVFTAFAILWALAFGLDLRFAPHDVAVHWFSALWMTAVILGLPFAWRWLEDYRYTASVAARIDAEERSLQAKVLLHLEGAKTAILMGVTSLFATAKDWLGSTFHAVTGIQPGDLDPLKDSTLLHTFFSDAVALKAMAGVTLFGAFLSIKSHLDAAKIVPAGASPAPTPEAAPVAPAAPAAS